MSDVRGRMIPFSDTAAAVGGGDLMLALRPPNTGVEWRIVWAAARQVSGGARQLTWEFTDGVTTAQLYGASVADSVNIALGQHDGTVSPPGLAIPFVCTYERYLQAHLVATGAGDDVYIVAVVEEIQGQESAR